ncbi:uncharacterized protein LOC133197555 [Saccostrea echinata]|uniref:uncharacterized protein LOC133197555 n=1 Tax=Saccostrea echinata TaxID=191078 RepID=UPI002A7EB00A|nr:uncharacterized protein LOC133197555 [Saccostrea echinata]
MATHFICQPTEPLAHRYPLNPGPGKGHGAVSHYELLNAASKPHTDFPPPGWDISQSSEESLPLCQVPIPTWRITSDLIGPDPQLCITPEKPVTKGRPKKPVPQSKPDYPVGCDPELCVTPEKSIANKKVQERNKAGASNGQHVRFDVSVSDNSVVSQDGDLISKTRKSYRPFDYSDNLEESEPKKELFAKPLKYALQNTDNKPVYVPLATESINNPSETSKSVTEDTSVKPVLPVIPSAINSKEERVISVLKSDNIKKKGKSKAKPETEPNAPIKHIKDRTNKRKVRVTRETQEKPALSDYTYPFSDPATDTVQEYEHVFMRPEYNSTLRMRKEIESLKESSVDVVKALDKKLQISETVSSDIREKASSKVNVSSPHFRGLVSLSVPAEDIDKVHTFRAKPVKPRVQSKTCEPDLMEFFSPEFQRESPELSTPGLSTPSEPLVKASPMTAFDLYRHNRVWDSNSYLRSRNK